MKKKKELFLVRLTSWISSLESQMSLRAAQESFYPHAGAGRCKPVRGIRDWCSLSFLVEMHPSTGEDPSEMVCCCTQSSFTSSFPPVLLKLKAIFQLTQYHNKDNFDSVSVAEEPLVFWSACVTVHLHPTPLIERAGRIQCLSAKSVSWTLVSLISRLGFWRLLSVLSTTFTSWGTWVRNSSANSYFKVRAEAQR